MKTTKKTIAKGTTRKAKPAKTSEFPGYPLYAAADDITNRATRTEADLDYPKGSPKIAPYTPTIDSEDEERQASGTKRPRKKGPNDVTNEDIKALGSDNLEMDGGDDEELRNRTTPVDFAGKDLDIPTDDDDNSPENAGSEDEENKPYSLGGDDHNDLEEDKA